MAKKIGKEVTILTYQRQGKRIKLPLRQLKKETDEQADLFPADDGGGCGCALHTREIEGLEEG